MTAIDLSRDLELWVDFDSEYWDAQRNQIQDQSGYGRHPTASGGPTVGVEGPNDFEAASFDETDDNFSIDESLDNQTAISVFGLVKPTLVDGTVRAVVSSVTNFSDGVELALGSSNYWAWNVVGTDGSQVASASNTVQEGEWYTLVGVWDGDEARIYVNTDEEQNSISTVDHDTSSTNLHIGSQPDNDSFLQGDIAAVGYWSKALSYAEITELGRLTAPRRAML